MTPKLLFVISEDWYFAAHRLALAKAANADGFDVSVATQVNAHRAIIEHSGLTVFPITMHRASINPAHALSELRHLTALCRQVKPDIVHNIAMKPVILGTRAARGAGVRAIVNSIAGLGYTFASNEAKARIARPVVRAALRGVLSGPDVRTTVENRDDFKQLLDEGLAQSASLRRVPGIGVDVARFDLPPPPDGAPLIVLPARLIAAKGIVQFVDAARLLKSEGVKARFALVGAPDPGNPTSISERQLEQWRSEGAVELWGWRTDMVAVLREATVVCLPSFYREGLPVSLLEAAASRRAIVTTDVPGCREIVDDGKCGWCVPPRDVPALAAGLRGAIENPQMRQAYAALAHQRALTNYDTSVIHRQTLGIYRELLERGRPAPDD